MDRMKTALLCALIGAVAIASYCAMNSNKVYGVVDEDGSVWYGEEAKYEKGVMNDAAPLRLEGLKNGEISEYDVWMEAKYDAFTEDVLINTFFENGYLLDYIQDLKDRGYVSESYSYIS